MDRQYYKSLKKYLIIWGASVLALTLLFVTFYKREAEAGNRQRLELTTIYPQLEEEIINSQEYYERATNREILCLWAFCVLVLSVGSVLLYLWERSCEHKSKVLLREDIDAIVELLEQLRNDSFKSMPDTDLKTDELGKLGDAFREAGYYFADMRARLEHEENSTKALITDISHQLKTPLSSLRMSHELTVSESLTESERKEFLTQEEQEIHKLEVLLEELVKLSKLEGHMIQISPQSIGIRETITEAVNQVFMKAHAKNIEIQVEMEGDMPVLHDPKWTVEALSNVLDNAIKYSQKNTHILVNARKLQKLFVIDIVDEGMGIPAKELNNIYKRFYRGKDAERLVKEGAGVGLYLTRRILDEQMGTITASKNPSGGTIFRITLPLE